MVRGLVCAFVVAFVCQAALAEPKRFPVEEVVTDDKPTAALIAGKFASGWKSPRLLKAQAKPSERGRADRMEWALAYDGIELDVHPGSVQRDGHWVTRFNAQLAGPERVRRANLIGTAKAVAAAQLRGKAKARLAYVPKLENKQIPGTKGVNAMDYDQVIASWRLTYRVEDENGGASVDAYTGALIDSWSNITWM